MVGTYSQPDWLIDRVALAPSAPRGGAALGTPGDRPSPRRHLRADRAASLLRLCLFGRDKPNGNSFLSELTTSKVEQISIEAAQPNLDLTTLEGLGGKT
jgi:hypothetical protein